MLTKSDASLYISITAVAIASLTFLRTFWLDRRTRVAAYVKASDVVGNGDAFISSSLSDRGAMLRALDGLNLKSPAVEVINLSRHTIFIDEVSFVNLQMPDGSRGVISAARVVMPPGPVPYRLEPMQSVTFYAPKNNMIEMLVAYDGVKVSTSHGYSKIFEIDNVAWLREHIASIAER